VLSVLCLCRCARAARQFLTNAIYLPYLVGRRAKDNLVTRFDPATLSTLERIGESRVTPLALTAVAAYAVVWALTARPEFGPLAERWASFVDLASSDRLTFSFVVDLAFFWVFQGWLVEDDLARRGGGKGGLGPLAAKYVPFVGLVAYFMTRPPLQQAPGKEA
jgi:hypothetical protein